MLDYLRAAPQRMLTFRQIAFDADGDVFSRGRGRVWFGSPNKFRLEQDGEDPLIVVSDGETLMRFDPILNQATISTAGDLARDSALAVLAGGDIEGRFSFFAPARPDDDGRRRVLARPKTDDGAAREIEFLFDAESRLLRLSFVDEFENTIRLDFGAEAATDFPRIGFFASSSARRRHIRARRGRRLIRRRDWICNIIRAAEKQRNENQLPPAREFSYHRFGRVRHDRNFGTPGLAGEWRGSSARFTIGCCGATPLRRAKSRILSSST